MKLATRSGIGIQEDILHTVTQVSEGTYLVVRKIEHVNVVLQRSSKAKPFVVHDNKLKKCFDPTTTSWLKTKLNPSYKEVLADGNTSKNLPEVCGSSDDKTGIQNDRRSPEVVQPFVLRKRLRRPPKYLFAYHC